MDKLLNFAPCGYLTFRDNGTIVLVNHTLNEWLGYADQTLVGQNIEKILTMASRIFYNTHFFPLIRLHGKAEEIFLSLKAKNNLDIPVLSNSVRTNDDGQFLNHCVFIAVHQRKKFEEEILYAKKLAEDTLHQNEELKALTGKLESRTRELDRQYTRLLSINDNLLQFSKIISHDLQEPIHKIKIFTSMIETYDGEKIAPKSKAAIQKIHRAADKLKLLTSGLEQFVKVDTEKTFGKVDLNKALASARASVEKERNFNDFEIDATPLPTIEGYATQLELLFYHLLDNAIQFRREAVKAVVKITGTLIEENVYRTTPGKYNYVEHVKITFEDNGIGFDNQYREYVFDLVKKISLETKGLGIGLSLIKKIVSNHAGTIEVQSEKDRGTQFTLLLPTRLAPS